MNKTLLSLLCMTLGTATLAANNTSMNALNGQDTLIEKNNNSNSLQQDIKNTQKIESDYQNNNYTGKQRAIISNKDRVFFAENSRRLGVITTDSGLQYQVLKAGLGRIPRNQHNVRISYEVKDLNDRSILRQMNQSIRLNHLMPILSEGIQTMREKGKTRFFIPTGLTSGIKSLSTAIPENTSLIIDVELQGIE